MKKIIQLVLALILALSLVIPFVSCDNNSNDDDDSGAPQNPYENGNGGIELPIIPLDPS